MINDYQDQFYALLDKYNDGIEPLENWSTEDLAALASCITEEIITRVPPANSVTITLEDLEDL